MFIINSDQEKCHFLNVCNFHRHSQFSQAELHNIMVKYSRTKVTIISLYSVHKILLYTEKNDWILDNGIKSNHMCNSVYF